MSQLHNPLWRAIRVTAGNAAFGTQTPRRLSLRGTGNFVGNSETPLQPKGPPFLRLSTAALLFLLAIVRADGLFGQGVTPVVMHTGSGSSLLSQSLSYTNGAGLSALTIDFGFATDEKPQPGFIADSFTISITGPTGTGYLVTSDANGTQWAPLVPGALPVSTSSLQWFGTPFLAPTQGLTNLASYAVAYTLPASWQGVPLTINFDLFDNQNALQSLAYYTIPIPEPSGEALLVLGFVLWTQTRLFSRQPRSVEL
jgi:hypothetical protein